MKFLGLIPARFASTRFPGKPLVKIDGKTMIHRVYEQAKKKLDDVCVATDDERIFDHVRSFGGSVVMTSTDHRSGTDRCREAMELYGGSFDVVVNIQGDEPFIHPEQIGMLTDCFDRSSTDIATLIKPILPSEGWEVLNNPNLPKVVVGADGRALYFSRSIIPHLRGVNPNEWTEHHNYFRHIGLYAYRCEVLTRIANLMPSPLETAECLEQLRWLEHGFVIQTAVTHHETIGIDTPEDLERVAKMLKKQLIE